jgi:hypothetical protein
MSEQPCERVKAERTIGTGHCMFPKFSLSFAFVHMCNWAGVGKTSLATALAETWLGSRRALVRVDAWPRQISLFFFNSKAMQSSKNLESFAQALKPSGLC